MLKTLIEYLYNSPIIGYFLMTWIGAICCHILSQYPNEFKGCLPFLKKMFPDWKDQYYNWIEFLILPLMGAIIALMTLEPSNFKCAFWAGISWVGTMDAIILRSNNK